MLTVGFLLLSIIQVVADPLPFTGIWRTQSLLPSGVVYRTEVRDGRYVCQPCANPIDNMPVDGADHAVPNSPDVYSIRAFGAQGLEVVRKTNGKVVQRTIRIVSDDGNRLEILELADLPNGDIAWFLTKRARVGERTPGAPPISGLWKDTSLEASPNALPVFSYEQTAEGLKVTDLTAREVRIVYDARFNGQDYSVSVADATTVNLRRIDDRTIDETWKQKGVEVARVRMVISDDGKTLTQTNYRGTEQTGEPQRYHREPDPISR